MRHKYEIGYDGSVIRNEAQLSLKAVNPRVKV